MQARSWHGSTTCQNRFHPQRTRPHYLAFTTPQDTCTCQMFTPPSRLPQARISTGAPDDAQHSWSFPSSHNDRVMASKRVSTCVLTATYVTSGFRLFLRKPPLLLGQQDSILFFQVQFAAVKTELTTWKQRPVQDMAGLACCRNTSFNTIQTTDNGGNRDTLTFFFSWPCHHSRRRRTELRPNVRLKLQSVMLLTPYDSC